MTPIKNHQTVVRLIDTGMCDYRIHKETGINRAVVQDIRKCKKIVSEIEPEKVAEIRSLLMLGMAAGAIEMQTKIARSKVLAVRRDGLLYGAESGENKASKCPTCGSMMYPKTEQGIKHKRPANEAARIICDLVGLYELRLIRHPLFHNLSQRAIKLLEKANDESKTR